MFAANADDGLIRFEFNTPVHVSLKYSDGKVIEGRYGESLLFTTTDGRRFFLPMSAGEQLAALGVTAGEPITVTKIENRNRGKVTASYKVQRDGVLSVQAPPVSVSPAPAPRPVASATTPGPALVPALPMSGAPGAAPAPAASNLRRYLYENYKVAVDVLVEVQKYAQARELPITFTAEDVRTLAATILIQQGGASWPR